MATTSQNFNAQWAAQKNLFADLERKQEEKAFMSDPDFATTQAALVDAGLKQAYEDRTPLDPNIPRKALTAVDATIKYVLAGNAVFTLRSAKTGVRFTFKVQKPKEGKQNPRFAYDPNLWFVKVFAGTDNTSHYKYMGLLKKVDSKGVEAKYTFKATAASFTMTKLTCFQAFDFMFQQIFLNKQMPADLEIWHSGHCGRCGKLLTVPESIERGLGPECAGKSWL